MWLLNGKKSVTFAGSWTLVNAHEVAVLSGIAAAQRLGAEYPIELEMEEDGFALLCFKLYYLLSHGKYYRARKGLKKLKGDGTGSFSIYGDKFPVRSSLSPEYPESNRTCPGRELQRKAHRPRITVNGPPSQSI